jgi:DNA-binding NarL/FixJ family response regulator
MRPPLLPLCWHDASSSTSTLAPAFPDEEKGFSIVIISRSPLYSDAMARSIYDSAETDVLAFPNVESWLEHRDARAALVLIYVSGPTRDAEAQELDLLLSPTVDAPPVVVLSDREAPEYIMDVLAKGASGYIPTSLSLDLTVKALCLVRAGGVFVPASCLRARQHLPHALPPPGEPSLGMFTERQIAVIQAIRMGKANKTIAYDLNMCESTVKVHIRNIMKKLRATNRTQVAFIADQMLREGLLTPKTR